MWTAFAVGAKIIATTHLGFALAQTKARTGCAALRRMGAGSPAARALTGRETSVPTLDRSVIAGLPPFEGLGPDDLDHILEQARASRYQREGSIF